MSVVRWIDKEKNSVSKKTEGKLDIEQLISRLKMDKNLRDSFN